MRILLRTLLGAAFLMSMGLSNAQTINGVAYADPTANNSTTAQASSSGSNASPSASVDDRTGRPVVTIPLWTMNAGEMSIPISVNYSSSGIIVDQFSSYLGEGWSLSAGGSITREVRGLPDDMKMNIKSNTVGYSSNCPYYGTGCQLFKGALFSETSRGYMKGYPDGYYSGTGLNTFNDVFSYPKFIQATLEGNLDTELDVFSFGFLGRSGKFIIDYAGNVRSINPQEKLKIEYNTGGLNGALDLPICTTSSEERIASFTITTSDGVKFEFSEIESIKLEPENYYNGSTQTTDQDGRAYNTAWHLTNIIFPNAEEVSFLYDSTTITTYAEKSRVGAFCDVGCDQNILQPPLPSATIDDQIKTTQELKLVKSIESSLEKVVFDNSVSRWDINSITLNKVDVYSKYNGVSTNIRTFDFEFDYSNENSTIQSGDRLFLSSIQEKKGTNSLPAVSFVYYDKNAVPTPYTAKQDLWGYFKGGTDQGVYSFPQVYYYPTFAAGDKYQYWTIPSTSSNYTTNYTTIPGKDRSPNSTYAKKGMLEKVNLPTGGYVKFNYEGNTFYDALAETNRQGPGVRVSQVIHYDNLKETSATTDYEFTTSAGGTTSSGELIYKPSMAWSEGFAYHGVDQVFSASHVLGGAGWLGYVSLSTNATSAETHKVLTQRSTSNLRSPFDWFGRAIVYSDVIVSAGSNGYTWTKYNSPYPNSSNPTVRVDSGYFIECDFANAPPAELGTLKSVAIGNPAYIENGSVDAYPFPPYSLVRNVNSDQINQIEVYNENDELLQRASYTYQAIDYQSSSESIQSYRISPVKNDIGTSWPGGYVDNENQLRNAFPFLSYGYQIKVDESIKLDEVTTRSYSGTSYLETIAATEFGSSHLMPTLSSTTNSDGIEYSTTIKYPLDFDAIGSPSTDWENTLNYMRTTGHFHSTPIETLKRYKSGSTTYITGGSITEYDNPTGSLLIAKSTYRLNLTSPVASTSFTESSSNSGSFVKSSNYVQESSIVLVNTLGKATEVQSSQLLRTNALIWNDEGNRLIANASNAPRSEIGISQFEENTEGDWVLNSSNSYSSDCFTGIRARLIQENSAGPYVLLEDIGQDKEYKFSAWVKTETGFGTNSGRIVIKAVDQYGGTTIGTPETIYFSHSSGDWVLITGSIDLATISTSSTMAVRLEVYNDDSSSDISIDDIRVHPINCLVTSYTRKASVGRTSSLDPNNFRQMTEYDDFGRMVISRDHDGFILQQTTYNNQ